MPQLNSSTGNNFDGYSDGASSRASSSINSFGQDAPSLQSSSQEGSSGGMGLPSPSSLAWSLPSPPQQWVDQNRRKKQAGRSSSSSTSTRASTNAGSSLSSLSSSGGSFKLPSKEFPSKLRQVREEEEPRPNKKPLDRKRKRDDLIIDREDLAADIRQAVKEIWPDPGTTPAIIQMFLGNLPPTACPDDIINFVFEHARIQTVIVDFIHKRRKFAFITILEEDKDAAITLLRNKIFQGNRIKVDIANKQQLSPPVIWSKIEASAFVSSVRVIKDDAKTIHWPLFLIVLLEVTRGNCSFDFAHRYRNLVQL